MTSRSRLTLRLTAYVSLSCALAACGAGTGGPPSVPSDPVGGAEPADPTGYEPPGGSPDMAPGAASSVEQLCAYDCMRFEAACAGNGGGSDCAASCARNAPSCRAQFQAYLACLAAAPLTCTNGKLEASGCDGAAMILGACSGTATGMSGGSAGATGSGGPK